jgi:hypothetical protein
MKWLSTCAIAALILLCGCQHDISGTYLVSDSGSVVWLQLVRTPDNHLTGQLTASVLKPDGRIDRNSASITGAVDGENVTLTGSGLFGLQSVTLSGAFSGDTLTLTGEQAEPLVFKRVPLTVYQTQLSELNGRAQAIVSAKAAAVARENAERSQRTFVQAIDRLVEQMRQFDQQADVHLSRFPGVEKQYEAITAKVRDSVEKERRLAGNPNASVTRSQLSIAATQASYETEQLHYQGQSLEWSMAPITNQLLTDGRSYGQVCQTLLSTPHANMTQGQAEAEASACDRLRGGIVIFRPKYNAFEGGLTHLEQVYTQEKNAQQALLQTAEKLQ